MWWSSKYRKAEERRHEEWLRVSSKLLQEAEEGAQLAKKSNRWQLVGSCLALLGIAVPVLLALQPWKGDPATPQVRALVQLVPVDSNGVIPKPISAIPAPPSYPSSQSDDHCAGWWKQWFGMQGAAAGVDGPLLEISAPQAADATVVSASIQVYGSYKPANLSYIACAHGAGEKPGTDLYVNLDRPNAYPEIVSEAGELTRLEMPGAVINIDPGHTEYVAVLPNGRQGMLYSWSMRLVVVVNQEQEEFTFGSPVSPLRTWFGSIPLIKYDYNMQSHSWQG